MGLCIYLNGPSSSGKTTLAKALQDALADPFLHLGIDKIIGFMPEKINDWKGGIAPLGFSWKEAVDPTGHPVFEVQSGPFAKKITRSMKAIAHLLLTQGYNIILDDIAFGAIEVEEWRDVLKDFKVLYVGVVSPLHILEKRELARGDRMIGSARGQYFKVHHNISYDLEVDTHAQTLDENVSKIMDAISR